MILITSAASPLVGQSLWVVSSASRLDARIQDQIKRLAREHHARTKFVQEAKDRKPESPGVLTLELTQSGSPEAFVQNLRKSLGIDSSEVTLDQAREAYSLGAYFDGAQPPRRISIRAVIPSGFHFALLRLAQLFRMHDMQKPNPLQPRPKYSGIESVGRATALTVVDFPSFPERGIVEGFYGKPWSHLERLDMLRFEGEHGMNVYYYAPKDDPYHRNLWREPYSPAKTRQLHELVKTSRENFVDFCFAISPGLSMTYASDADFQKLTGKLDSVAKLAVSCFALFLDDVPQHLENPEDLARYKTLAAAHVDVINRLYEYLKSQSRENRLVVAPTTYTNAWGSRDYIRDLGAGVNRDVAIVWTGLAVVSPEITAAQAQEWGALLRRKPLVWDNFPVNDGVSWRLNLGPLRGRDANLPGAVRGFISNPMNQAQASKIPLSTIAEYLWNSAAYDADAAYQRALKEQYGPTIPRQLDAFLSTYGDYWWDENIFQPLFTERRSTFDTREIGERIALLARSVSALRQHSRTRELARELAPFPIKTRARLAKVVADPAFEHLPGGKLRWREDYDVRTARHLTSPPKLDGDFSKWEDGKVYSLDQASQIFAGRRSWRGPGMFSARYAFGWDESHFYLGVDVTNPELYQPFSGRDIGKGDVVALLLETAFRKNFNAVHPGGDEYSLLFSPGDFQAVAPGVYSQEDYISPRPVPRDFGREIQTGWKKTVNGFSGDIVIPAAWFDGGKFSEGYEVGIVLSAQKVLAPAAGNAQDEDTLKRILFRSKSDRTFPARFGNPATYQRIVLAGPADGN